MNGAVSALPVADPSVWWSLLDSQVALVDAERAAGAWSQDPAQSAVCIPCAPDVPIVNSLLMVARARRDDVRRVVAPAVTTEHDVMAVEIGSFRASRSLTAVLVAFEDAPPPGAIRSTDHFPSIDRISDQNNEGSPSGKRSRSCAEVVQKVVPVLDDSVGRPEGDPIEVSLEVQ